ncbi:amidohydrolase family protein [Membranihabitans marinus]|uniref:amidohydrolase family protein n=1 Tax=Membranihabitans marinus TaxID=1227546 RepID=UPI001F48DD5F|nr:amidohydrolase family protein [Membranihabitans marinus]
MNNAKRYITADEIYPVIGDKLTDKVLVFEGETIVDIIGVNEVDDSKVEKYHGLLMPGFVNAHCHLELSHMKGKIPTGSGLLSFLYAVVSMRSFPEEEIMEAIAKADKEMWENGIVAVGDICNTPHTSETKSKSKIMYHSFVEMFDFLQDDQADHHFDQYYPSYLSMPSNGFHSKSIVPHAPYTVSNSLYNKINKAEHQSAISSIHMLESQDENYFCSGKDSGYYDFYRSLGMDIPRFNGHANNALHHYLSQKNQPDHVLFVHGTIMGAEDIALIKKQVKNPYLVSCPNANLFIENKLPRYADWQKSDIPICLGTDSYSSNWQLSIFQEMKTIAKYQSHISFLDMMAWATINGAAALGKSDILGSLEIGKSPGLVNFKGSVEHIFEDNEEGIRVL